MIGPWLLLLLKLHLVGGTPHLGHAPLEEDQLVKDGVARAVLFGRGMSPFVEKKKIPTADELGSGVLYLINNASAGTFPIQYVR